MELFKPTWMFRSPPENVKILQMCNSPQNCLFGMACTKAHSPQELQEWSIRISYEMHENKRSMMERKCLSQIESIRNIINESSRLGLPPKNVLTEVSGGQSVLCKQNLFVTHLDKNKEIFWEFIVKTNYNNKNHNSSTQGLQNVFFLENDCREFSFSSLTNGNEDEPLKIHGSEFSLAKFYPSSVMFAKICVKFRSPSYGHFNVTIIFDFGFAPRIVRHVGVVVAPEKHLFEKLSSTPITTSDEKHNELTWMQKYKLISFDDSSPDDSVTPGTEEYPLPANLKYGVEYGAFEYMDVNLTPENFRDRLHNLLFVEEYERRKRMSRLNVHCHDIFTLFRKRTKLPSLRTVDAQKAVFIPMSEETLEEVGILVTRGSKALIRLRQFMYGADDSEDFVVHEALVINILCGEIILEISSKTLTLLKSMSSPVPVDICFRFVNTFLCMHSAIDRVNLDLIFYQPLSRLVNETNRKPLLLRHSQLSPTQATALSGIINSSRGPPVLLLGPFGTGKTQTVAEAVKILISEQSQKCRILICTHSNSAADHYIEDYLHPLFTKDENTLCEKPLRLYWEHRLATSISDTMLPYCIMDLNTGTFRNPTLEELARKTIVVTTLVTADLLIKCGVKPGFFTHILIDEAAQAMEVETLIPLSLATKETKVVLAGDHLQLSPPVFSSIGRKLQLDKSLLVRLYEAYPANSPRKILLLENFRSYPELVNIPSKLFYEGSLISKKQLPGDLQYPVKLYGVYGLEEKTRDSPSYVNMAEVAEITERVEEMVNTWPKQHFGELKLEKTCVLSAHYGQIRQVRRELRLNGLHNVRVENINNVQGLEFDVLFLSTVRTSRVLSPGQHEGKDLGLLSNPKLLNTAITRAKFCLVVIGDPKALCSVGDCRVCWKTILSLCSENGTFHYRLPLTQVLNSIREEQTQMLQPEFNNSLQQYQPRQYHHVTPPIPNRFPFFPEQMGGIRQVHPLNMLPVNPLNMSPNPPTALSTAPRSYPSIPQYTPYPRVLYNNVYDQSPVGFHQPAPQTPTFVTPPNYPSQTYVPEVAYNHVGGNRATLNFGSIYSQHDVGFSTGRPHANPFQIGLLNNSTYATNLQAQTGFIVQSTSSSPAPRPRSDTKHQSNASWQDRSYNAPSHDELSTLTNELVVKLDPSTSNIDGSHPDIKSAKNEFSNPATIREESSLSEISVQRAHEISPTRTLEESSIVSLCQNIRKNVVASLRHITECEEAMNMFIEDPSDDASVEIRENLKAQLALVRHEKSLLEQQQTLNRTLAKNVHSLQVNAVKNQVHRDPSLSLSPNPRLTHVYKIDLDSDHEVQEWYRLRRQDPIVNDYIKSFEMLLERARTRGHPGDKTTESCEITAVDNSDLMNSLRGWVLQPQSVFYPSEDLLYETYLGIEEVNRKLENGELVCCALSMDKSSSGKSASCVVDDPMEKNIVIPDRKSMNRAFNTDLVAVEITHDPEGQNIKEGKVVAIIQERHHRRVICRLASPESTLMIPLNNTNPKFSILQSDNHVGQTGVAVFDIHGDQIRFHNFVSDVEDKLFLVQFLKWDVSYRYPLGFVAKCFEDYNDMDKLIPILCFDYGIQQEFPAAVIKEIELRFPESWQLPKEELESRCRYEDAFTIDSEGAEELDDAISVRPVKYGIYSITVHVTDVSYFVVKGSLIDRIAQERATSVYLPSNITLTLLPKRLSHICSLLPGKERLAVSIEFVIDLSGNILRSPIFRRSVVVSQRQLSFDDVDGFLSGEKSSTQISSPVLRSLQILHCLSRELWARRVRGGSFQACAEAHLQPPSRRIVEELMIIANMAVANKLSNLPDSHVAPLRVQQSPKYHVLQALVSWAAENGVNLNETWLTQWLTGYQEQESSHSSSVCVNLKIWQHICQEIKIGNMADLTEEILSQHKKTPITPRLQRNLPRSKYVSSNQYSSTERRHFSLNADCYTHFTSPIRRYLDIVVHRVLFSEATAPLYDDDEMEELCGILNLRCGVTAAFSKHCTAVLEAKSLQSTDGWRTMEIDSVESECMMLKNVDNSKASSLHKLKMSDMGASMSQDEAKKFVAYWRFHDLDVSGSKQHSRPQTPSKAPQHPSSSPELGGHVNESPLFRGNFSLQHPLAPSFQRERSASLGQEFETSHMVEIPEELWCELLNSTKKEDASAIVKSMDNINKHAVVSKKPSSTYDGSSMSIDTSGFNVLTCSFQAGEKLQVLFTCSSVNGLPQLLLQAINVIPEKICCILHHRQPVECFCDRVEIPAREKYSSSKEYQQINIPLLKMESAEKSVRAKLPSLHIRNVVIKWTKDASNAIHGELNIRTDRFLPSAVHKDDFVCVYFISSHVIHHGCVEDVPIPLEESVYIRLVLNSGCTTEPLGAANVEVIPQCINFRRMIYAVRSLPNGTEDVCSLFLKRFLRSSIKQSRSKNAHTSSFTLDSSQRKAMDGATHSSFTIIEGLSGTGKTYTAAAIAEQFFLENSSQKSTTNVLLCCPTNQAVNDAENILSRVPTVRILRLYEREIEIQSFPELIAVYGCFMRSSETQTILQDSALHFKIRSSSNPFHRKIQKYANKLQMLTEYKRGDMMQLRRVIEEYKKVIDMAEEYELTEHGVNIILCTCNEAGSSRMENHARVKQCIIDESHHSPEAESLSMFQTLNARCERIVLLGDTTVKNLPIIENKLARRFGLNKSVFSSLRNGKGKNGLPRHVLDTQHRMLGI